jgi:hypothetical protein
MPLKLVACTTVKMRKSISFMGKLLLSFYCQKNASHVLSFFRVQFFRYGRITPSASKRCIRSSLLIYSTKDEQKTYIKKHEASTQHLQTRQWVKIMSTEPYTRKTTISLHQMGTRNISHTPRCPLSEMRALIWFNRHLASISCTCYIYRHRHRTSEQSSWVRSA